MRPSGRQGRRARHGSSFIGCLVSDVWFGPRREGGGSAEIIAASAGGRSAEGWPHGGGLCRVSGRFGGGIHCCLRVAGAGRHRGESVFAGGRAYLPARRGGDARDGGADEVVGGGAS